MSSSRPSGKRDPKQKERGWRHSDIHQQQQEQEREQAQEAEAQAQEQQAQADRQAVRIQQERARMASSLQWNGDRLLPGEHVHCELHLLEFRNAVELEGTGAYRYASGYADVALRNAVDERPGPRATELLMLSLDRDLAADLPVPVQA